MLCEKCHKREVVVKFTQVIGSEKKTVNLCKQCAEEQGLNNPLLDISKVFGKIIVAILSDHLASKSTQETDTTDSNVCDVCGLSWADFEKTGRLGCPRCYDVHIDHLNHLLRRLHGNNRHIGKSSRRVDDKQESLDALKKRLDKAIKTEDYETAAELRDSIRLIEHGQGTSSS
jgi:protein arginine kinase activator